MNNNSNDSRQDILKSCQDISREIAPTIFLPFALTLIPALALVILSFGIGLILTGIIWVILDVHMLNYFKTGRVGVASYFTWNKTVITYLIPATIRRIIIILGYACLIAPGIYFSVTLSNLPYIMSDNPDIKNPITLLRMTYASSIGHRYALLRINVTTFYVTLLTVLSMGIIAPWSIIYLKTIKVSYYCRTNRIELSPEVLALDQSVYNSPPDFDEPKNTIQGITN